MVKLIFILLPALVFAPSASAEIYKCVGKGGLDLYQNFPCQFDSIGWKPENSQSQKAPSISSDTNPEKAKAGLSDTAHAGTSAPHENVPRRGMTADEVRAIWGEPTGDPVHGLVAILRTDAADGGLEIWTYGTTRSVQFDPNGRVSVVRR